MAPMRTLGTPGSAGEDLRARPTPTTRSSLRVDLDKPPLLVSGHLVGGRSIVTRISVRHPSSRTALWEGIGVLQPRLNVQANHADQGGRGKWE